MSCFLTEQLESRTVLVSQCPSCRNEAVIPDGDISNFEVDFRVNRLQEVLARLQQFESPVSSKVAKLRPEVNKSAVALRSFLRQVSADTRIHKSREKLLFVDFRNEAAPSVVMVTNILLL